MADQRVSTGVAGLDDILQGGVLPGRAYLVRGEPGTGKTTLGLHFLTAGVTAGEDVLFITLSEPEAKIRADAAAIGFDLTGVTVLDLSPTPELFAEAKTYDIFSPADVEREPTTRKISEQVQDLQPQRVFVDAITQFRYLASDDFQFHKQTLSFLHFLTDQGATVLYTSEGSDQAPDDELQFMSDGVIHLQITADHAVEDRTLAVTKLRGSGFWSGGHSMQLTGEGMKVFPRLLPQAYTREFTAEAIPSGVPELDQLLGGGLTRGTVTLLTGPTGAGKTTLGLQFMKEAAGRGERSVVYAFEEGAETLLQRCEAINIPVGTMIERGTLSVTPIEPLRYTPDQFAHLVRQEVEQRDARIVMLDGVAGYRLAVRGGDLTRHLRALATYLKNMGVTVIVTNEVAAITDEFQATEAGISFLADTIVFLRYLELEGQIRKAIGVLKKRTSTFEKSLREFEITHYGIKVGAPLCELRGILTGTPEWVESAGRDGAG